MTKENLDVIADVLELEIVYGKRRMSAEKTEAQLTDALAAVNEAIKKLS